MQNIILCAILNFQNWLESKTTTICKIFRNFWHVTEMNFTLLPGSQIFILEKQSAKSNIYSLMDTFRANFFSLIPERQKMKKKHRIHEQSLDR